MTMIIGARCKDGVALVADRRKIVHGYEVSSPGCKLGEIKGLVIGWLGIDPLQEAVERGLMAKDVSVASCWDLADVVSEVAEKYEALKEGRPGFPVAGLVDGVAHLYQVLIGYAPGEISYECWGIADEYGAMGRLIEWTDVSVDLAWKVITVFIRIAAEANVAVGDGVDAAVVRDGDSIEIITNTGKVWDRAQTVVDKVLAVVREEMEQG